MHLMVCISGFSGSGKDEFAKRLLQNYNAIQTGLADPGKRHMADAYGFTEQQLFGPSQFRNAGDLRYPKNNQKEVGLRPLNGSLPTSEDGLIGALDPEVKYWVYEARGEGPNSNKPYVPTKLGKALFFVREGDPEFWLSPREALQQYLEKMNNLYLDTWIRKGIEDQLLLATGKYKYNRMHGVTRDLSVDSANPSDVVTCFADFRHIHEVRYTRHAAQSSLVPFTPVLVRVKRPSITKPPFNHRSETEQVQIRDAAFDFIVHNDKTIEYLHSCADDIVKLSTQDGFKSKVWDDSYVIPNRKPEEGYAP